MGSLLRAGQVAAAVIVIAGIAFQAAPANAASAPTAPPSASASQQQARTFDVTSLTTYDPTSRKATAPLVDGAFRFSGTGVPGTDVQVYAPWGNQGFYSSAVQRVGADGMWSVNVPASRIADSYRGGYQVAVQYKPAGQSWFSTWGSGLGVISLSAA